MGEKEWNEGSEEPSSLGGGRKVGRLKRRKEKERNGSLSTVDEAIFLRKESDREVQRRKTHEASRTRFYCYHRNRCTG